MSQTENENQTPAQSPSLDATEFEKAHNEYVRKLQRSALRSGPAYNEAEGAPLVWHDQLFERELTPSGIVSCSRALGVGRTQNGLDLILVGSHVNTGPVQAAKNATVTLITLQSDEEFGEYEAVGPSICVTAPAEGIKAEPDQLFCRLPLINFSKPWLMVRLEFSGTISGGKLDAALSYVAR